MVKNVAADDKARDANKRRNYAEHEKQREKHAFNIITPDEKKKAHYIMEDAQFMIK